MLRNYQTKNLPTSLRAKAEIERRKRAKAQQAQFLNPDPVAWIEQHFWIPDLNGTDVGLIELAPYQKRCLHEALRRDAQGNFVYSVILWSDIKKSIKSTIAAAVALWHAYQSNWGQIIVVANDLKQADSRIAYYLRRAVELNPAMKKNVQTHYGKTVLPNKTFIEPVPIDPTGEAGGNADAVFYSELWGAHSNAQQRMWTETTLSPTKFGKSFRWVESYAGFTGESPLLEQLYERAVHEEYKLWPDTDIEAYAVGGMFCLWNTQPRLSWQTPEYYAQEEVVLGESEFQRVHRNRWAQATEKFVDDAWVDACVQPMPPFGMKEPMVVALDAAVSGDCFGILGVSKRGDTVYERYARKWTPPKGGKLDYKAEDGPEQAIRWLAKQYNVVEFCYDPYQLHSLATELGNAKVGKFEPFDQGKDRLIADKQLQDLIREQRFNHRGGADVVEHLKNAQAKKDGDSKLRIIKPSSSKKVDLAVCASMASARILGTIARKFSAAVVGQRQPVQHSYQRGR